MASTEQQRVFDYIRSVLTDRGFDLPPGVARAGDRQCLALEHNGRLIGVDEDSGILVKAAAGDWESISDTGTIGAALEAVEFLIKG